jgi:hypothetical protein
MILVLLIHNDVEHRTSRARTQAKTLAEDLAGEYGELFGQGRAVAEPPASGRIATVLRIFAVRRIYRGRHKPVRKNSRKGLSSSRQRLFAIGDWWRNVSSMKRVRNRALLLKHLHAHSRFLESCSAEVVLVLEDDAILLSPTAVLAADLLEIVATADVPVFLEMTGSFTPAELGVQMSPAPGSSALLVSAPATSNTTAAYACNRAFSELFLSHCISHPEVFLLPIDVALDYFFLSEGFQSHRGLSLHQREPSFLHGSLHGHFETTI